MESNHVNSNMEISEDSKVFLLETAKWARFISIVSFVGLGIFALVGILFLFSIIQNVMIDSPSNQVQTPILGVIYLLMALLYFFPTTYLYRFATSINSALENSEVSTLDLGFENLKSLFRYIGILMIIALSFYVLAFFVVIAAAIFH